MANWPADASPARASRGRRRVSAADAAPPPAPAAPPSAGHKRPAAPEPRHVTVLAWLPYLLLLAGVAAGTYTAWQGPDHVGHGAGIVGACLLAAALGRLVLPPRWLGPLSTRRKSSDVLAFAAFGGGVIAVALMLP
jgi:hypothetical protein